MKNHLKWRDFSLLRKRANKNPIKNVQSFLCVTVTCPLPPSPQISCFRSVHCLSSNNSENTNHRHLPLNGTDHCNSRLYENIHFWRNNCSFQNYNFLSKSKVQFSIPILDGLCVSFNAHHFFVQKQFMWVDCYTGRLTFSDIILHKRAIRWILVASQAEMRKDECVRSCSI